MNEARPSVAARLRTAFLLLLVVVAVPAGAAATLAGGAAARSTAMGAVFGLLLIARSGWGVCLVALPALVAAGVAGAALVGTGWWVLLLAGLGGAAGLAVGVGFAGPVALLGVVAAAAPPFGADEPLALRAATSAVGVLWAVVVLRRLGAPKQVRAARIPRPAAAAVGVVVAVVVAAAAKLALATSEELAYWVPVTVFVLVMPGPDLRLGHEARGRIAGTLLGIAIGVTIGVGVDAVPVRTTVALLGVLVAIGFADPRWLGAAGSTVAIVLMLDPAGTGVRVGEVRLAALVTGVALTAAGAGVLAWWLRHPATASRVRVLTGGAEEAEMTQDLTITHLPAEHALVLRLRVTLPTIGPSLGDGFGRVAGQAAAMGARIVGPPFAMYPEEPVGEFAVVVGFPIAPGTAVPAEGDGVELLDLPAADAVDVMFRGPYDGIGAAWGEIMAWMAANGRTMGAPCREVYLNSPDEVPPEGLLTRLLMPLA